MARSSAASKFVLFGLLIASISAAPSFADDVERCFEDNSGQPLAHIFITVHRGTPPFVSDEDFLTDDQGCSVFNDVEPGYQVTVHLQNKVVRMDAGEFPFLLFPFGLGVDLMVDAGDAAGNPIPVDVDNDYTRIAENMRLAYNNGLFEFSPWQTASPTESPNGHEDSTNANALRVVWPSIGVVGLAYTEPAGPPSGYPRIHMDGPDAANESLQRHELAHALHLSKLSSQKRLELENEYVGWLVGELSLGNSATHSFAVDTSPLVAFIEAFGCFGEVYSDVVPISGDKHQDFFERIANNLESNSGGCGSMDDAVRGGDVEGAVFLAIFYEFAKHPAVGLPFVVETIIECESFTVYEYANCILELEDEGLESDVYQALDLAGAVYGIDFDREVEIRDQMETGDRFGDGSAAGDFNGDGFMDLAVTAPGEETDYTANSGAVHILFGSSLALVSAQNQYFRATDLDALGWVQSDDRFGAALAAGDFDADGYDDLAIGVPGRSVSGFAAAGSVVVLYGSAAGLETSRAQNWHQDSSGIPDDNEPGDGFGSALAAGDFNADGYSDLAIGAPGEDLPIRSFVAIKAKRALAPSAISWPVLPITGSRIIPNTGAGRERALPVTNLTEITGAGRRPALPITSESRTLRAERQPSLPTTRWINIPDAGAVTVLYGGSILKSQGLSGAGSDFWNQSLPNLLETAEPGDRFGSVLAAGNFNGDVIPDPTPSNPNTDDLAIDDLAIGVPLEDIGSIENAGAVHVLYGQHGSGLTDAGTSVWHQNTEGIEDHAEANDFFGSALAAGNFTAWTSMDLAIGVPGEDVDVFDPSARPGRPSRPPLKGERGSEPIGRLPDRGTGPAMRTVIDAGAVNVLVGQSWLGGIVSDDDLFLTESGWSSHSDPETGDHFGATLAAGDFDNDGDDDLAIGVPNQDVGDGAEGAGAVDVIFSDVYVAGASVAGTGLASAGNQQLHELSPYVGDHPAAGDRFGTSITAADFNGDERSELAIGVPGESEDGHESAGALHVMPGFEMPESEHLPLPDYEGMDLERRDDIDEILFSAMRKFGYLPQYWHQDR